MTLPSVDTGLTFAESKTREPGQPTEAEADHNVLADNTDYLKEASVIGWGVTFEITDQCSQSHNRKFSLDANAAKTMSDVGGVTNGRRSAPFVLVDVSSVQFPQESATKVAAYANDITGFLSRKIRFHLCGMIARNGQKTAESMMPYGANAATFWSEPSGDTDEYYFFDKVVTFFSSAGSTVGSGSIPTSYFAHVDLNMTLDDGSPVGDGDLYFYVDDTTGDMMCVWQYDRGSVSQPADTYELALYATIEIGSTWEDLT